MTRSRRTDTDIPAKIRAQKEELRKRIERDRQLTTDFDFLIEKSGFQPGQLLTGLWFELTQNRQEHTEDCPADRSNDLR